MVKKLEGPTPLHGFRAPANLSSDTLHLAYHHLLFEFPRIRRVHREVALLTGGEDVGHGIGHSRRCAIVRHCYLWTGEDRTEI